MNVKKKAGLLAALAGVFAGGVGAQDATDENSDEMPLEMEEIVVVGTHIRGVENVGAASLSFSREELDQSGFTTVEEFFESLPQNLNEISADAVTGSGVSRIAGSNTQGATGISLRGLGPGSTLVLLNGKRRPGNINGRVFDVSAIPLSMIERIEIVTGGRSAIYGSDAVAGVVNIVMRDGLDGAETQVTYGEASAGGEQLGLSQSFGWDFERGGFVLGYTYRDDQLLDATDAGVARGPSIAGLTPIPGLYYLRNESEQHVGLFAGHLELGENAELYVDAHFSSDKNQGGQTNRVAGCCDFGQIVDTESDQFSFVAGAQFAVGSEWQVDVSALTGAVDNRSVASLIENENPVEMVVYPDEWHIKWHPVHRASIYERNVDWLNFWLQGLEDSDPSKKPQYDRWRKLREQHIVNLKAAGREYILPMLSGVAKVH